MTSAAEWISRLPEDEAMDDPEDVAAYDRLSRRWLDKVIYPAMLRALPGLPAGARLLDACTGPGRLALALVQGLPDARVTGIDLSGRMLDLARAHAAESKHGDRLFFACQDAAAMTFDDDTFDTAITYGALHHWSEPTRVFAELARVVRPGGVVLVGDWRRDPAPLTFFRSLRGTREWQLLEASARAAYLEPEVAALLAPLADVAHWHVDRHPIGLMVTGQVIPGPSLHRAQTAHA
jgi:ubiquinone/menaquinone biosynthesis C-methylase UbiE